MGLIVQRSKDLIERLTSHSIAFYTSGQLFLEEYYALAVVGKAGLSTLHMRFTQAGEDISDDFRDGNTRLCTATAAASMRESFGSDGQPGSYTDIDYTDCLFLVGHNVAATQTVLWSRMLDRLEGPNPPELIVIDPRMSDTARRATVHLAPKIGTNLAVLNGIQHLIFKNIWVNEGFVSKHVIGLEQLEKTVEDYTPEKVEQISSVPAKDLEKAATIIGSSKSLLSTALQGVYQSNQATASACQINNINLLRGLIGKPGSGVLQMNGQPTAQNNREAGCDGEFPGFRNHMNPVHMQELAGLWNIDPIKVPHWNEPTHVQNLLSYIEDGSIRMMWISGTNPLVSLPNLPRVRKLLTDPGLFVVCQDIFMTETAAIADVVLPAAQWGEKTGCFTNVDRTVHLSHKAVEPPGEARSDLDIFLDYGRLMNFRDKDDNLPLPYKNSEEVFCAWKKLSRGRPCDYSGLSYEKLTGGSGVQWPCNEANPQGAERLFADAKFFTDIDACESFGHDLETGAPYSKAEYAALNPAGRAILKSCHYTPSMEEPNEEYPFRLSTGRNKYQFHTRTKTGRSKKLQDACPEPEVRISREDAAKMGLQTGNDVVVRSRRGAVELKAKVGGISVGQVFVPFHFGYWDAKDGKSRAANELTVERWDPISKQPMFKSGAVRIEKIEASEKPQFPELQSAAEKSCLSKGTDTTAVDDSLERKRHLESWLGETYESVKQLSDIYTNLLPDLIHDLEIEGGIRVMHRITEDVRKRLSEQVDKFGEDVRRGSRKATTLREVIFPPIDTQISAYEVMETLQGLHIYLSHIEGGLNALIPVSQACWDQEFFEAVQFGQTSMHRMQAWVNQQIKVKAPQSLLVPALVRD
ncbi:periplasmic nitrate [Colletotrichum tofieldiae]|nr:periplasmic nitrate [Colletotrichum tofieldiae]GKT74981.1 periplasmic nitrate [Colletotrichum tofieldiae]